MKQNRDNVSPALQRRRVIHGGFPIPQPSKFILAQPSNCASPAWKLKEFGFPQTSRSQMPPPTVKILVTVGPLSLGHLKILATRTGHSGRVTTAFQVALPQLDFVTTAIVAAAYPTPHHRQCQCQHQQSSARHLVLSSALELSWPLSWL